jgi:hypothetical protein
MTERYVLKYHPVLENGQRSINPIQLGHLSDVKEFGSIFMYHFAKLFASRKRDFIVESTKKNRVSKNDSTLKNNSTLNNNPRQSIRMAPMDDDRIKAGAYSTVPKEDPPMYVANYDSMATSSAIDSKGYYATDSYLASDAPVTATDTIQIDTLDEGNDEEDETKIPASAPPVESFSASDAPVTAADTIQIGTLDDDDDEEIDETQVLNEISKF